MALSEMQKVQTAAALRLASDEYVQQPLWDFVPAMRPAVIHERRRRFGVDEETGDPEYS